MGLKKHFFCSEIWVKVTQWERVRGMRERERERDRISILRERNCERTAQKSRLGATYLDRRRRRRFSRCSYLTRPDPTRPDPARPHPGTFPNSVEKKCNKLLLLPLPGVLIKTVLSLEIEIEIATLYCFKIFKICLEKMGWTWSRRILRLPNWLKYFLLMNDFKGANPSGSLTECLIGFDNIFWFNNFGTC